MGVDFTSCTVLPVTPRATPLCTLERCASAPHAWPKLWKHHAAQPVADRLNEVALERGEAFLARYGGRISSEWYFPKLIELWLEDREVYDAARLHRGDRLDRLVADRARAPPELHRGLQGDVVAGRGAAVDARTSRPPTPGSTRPGEKLGHEVRAARAPAPGTLRAGGRQAVGLPESVAVAVGNVDSFVSVPGAGVTSRARS